MVAGLDTLVARIRATPSRGRRRLVAIAGAPASGKSTLAASLTEALRAAGEAVENVPMDGFHLDNRLLDGMGLRARKGAPETFDAEGFRVLVERLKAEERVYFPLFDRGQDQAIAGAGVVPASCRLVVIEGNYLLFDEAPWAALASLWDLSIWIDTPEALVRARCIRRWLDHGHSEAAAITRAEGNDLRNARRVMGTRLPADVTLHETDGGAMALS
jgi:fructokinase